jgi:hypothetical protein
MISVRYQEKWCQAKDRIETTLCHTLSKQYSGSIQGNVSLLTLATPWLHLGYTLARVCEIRNKGIKKQ